AGTHGHEAHAEEIHHDEVRAVEAAEHRVAQEGGEDDDRDRPRVAARRAAPARRRSGPDGGGLGLVARDEVDVDLAALADDVVEKGFPHAIAPASVGRVAYP